MKISMDRFGFLEIEPENAIEIYALQHWWESWSARAPDAGLRVKIPDTSVSIQSGDDSGDFIEHNVFPYDDGPP